MSSLIPAGNQFAVAAAVFGLAALGMYLERFGVGRKLSGALIALGLGLILSNLRVLPFSAPTYDFVNSYLVPAAIPLLLLKANLRRILAESGPTLIAFLLGAVGIILGAALGFAVWDLGPDGPKVAGVLTGSYVGGSMNFVAVAAALEFDDPSRVTAALATDNIAGILFLVLLAALPGLAVFRRLFPLRGNEREKQVAGVTADTAGASGSIQLLDVTVSLAISLAVCAVGFLLAELVGAPNFGILFITILAVGVANIAPRRLANLRGDFEIGMLLMYLFFVGIGAGADIGSLAGSAVVYLPFVFTMLVGHCVVLLVGARLLRLSYAEVITGSNACVLGPPTAAALAANNGWYALVTPGILCGVFGYVIANFLGVMIAAWVG